MIRFPAFLRNKIKTKVFTSFLVVLFLMVAIFIVSYTVINRLGRASENILRMNYNSIIYAVQMMQELDAVERYSIALTTDDSLENRQKKIRAQNNFFVLLSKSKDNVTELGEADVLKKIETSFYAYLLSIEGIMPTDHTTLVKQSDPLRASVSTECKLLLALNQRAMFEKSSRAQIIARQGGNTLIVVVILVMILGIVLSYKLSTRIVKPIFDLVHATQNIAQGDYSFHIANNSDDELGVLINKFNDMTRRIQEFSDINLRAILEEKQKIEAVFSNITDGILLISPDFVIREANSQAIKALNIPWDKVKEHHILEVVNDEKIFEMLKSCIDTHLPSFGNPKDNYLVNTKDAKQVFYQYSFSPVLTDRGDLLGALFLLRDITELKELDRLKSEFVMIVSHELKTPLTSINMSIDLLLESLSNKLDASDMELLQIAKDDVLRLRLLVSDLLQLSKIEAGRIDLKMSLIELPEMLVVASSNFKAQITEKGISLNVVNTSHNIPRVRGDEDKLLWVFSNLISNAIKAVSKGGNIILKAERSGDFVVVTVSDDGIGIPYNYQQKIFDKFVQIPGSSNSQGTGLGLMICKEIIRAHGGTIWVESEPGKGSEFIFSIPIAKEHNENLFHALDSNREHIPPQEV